MVHCMVMYVVDKILIEGGDDGNGNAMTIFTIDNELNCFCSL